MQEIQLSADEEQEIADVFALIDHEKNGGITQAALTQALLGSGLLDEPQARELSARATVENERIDVSVFRSCLLNAVQQRSNFGSTTLGSTTSSSLPDATPTLGAGLLGILEDLRKFFAQERSDFRLANACKETYNLVSRRESERRMQRIMERQASEQHGVQEAQMMQALEFNSAWTQNMAEFEKQAAQIIEQTMQRQQQEFDEYREKLRRKEPLSYKFSRDLLQMKASVDTLARQGRYDEAHKLKRKVEQLEKWESLKLENEYATHLANKELQLRQRHQLQLEALQKRIQRGREEHKEHWLSGAQRLMQSHRNMISDLKSKQAMENLRAEIHIKLGMSGTRLPAVRERIKSNYADVKPRVPPRRSPASGSSAGSSLRR